MSMFNNPQRRIMNGVGQIGAQLTQPIAQSATSAIPGAAPAIPAIPAMPAAQALPTQQPMQPVGNTAFNTTVAAVEPGSPSFMRASPAFNQGFGAMLQQVMQKRRAQRFPGMIADRRAAGLPTPRADAVDAARLATPGALSWFEQFQNMFPRGTR